MVSPLFEVCGVTKVFTSGVVRKHATVALEDFSLAQPDEPAAITTIAGESGSGKTTLARLVLGFLTPSAGQILYKGRDIARTSRREWLDYRREVQAIFQDPYEVYNPFYKVDHVFQVVIAKFHLARGRGETQKLMEQSLEVVGLRPGEVLGTRQTGEQQFHIADLLRDQALLPQIEQAAQSLQQNYPQHVAPIIRRWLGGRESYAEV